MGDLIDLLDKLSEKYKFNKEDINSLGAAIAKMKGHGQGVESESDDEFDSMKESGGQEIPKPQGSQEEMGEAE